MIDSMHVLDVLRERGYIPQDGPDAGEAWFDRRFGPLNVRAVLTEGDDNEIIVTTESMVTVWAAQFSGAPGAVFLATLDAAEREAQS